MCGWRPARQNSIGVILHSKKNYRTGVRGDYNDGYGLFPEAQTIVIVKSSKKSGIRNALRQSIFHVVEPLVRPKEKA